MNLSAYIELHVGENLEGLVVISPSGRKGVVTSISWAFFEKYPAIVDIERVWVTIGWEGGGETATTADFLTKVKVWTG